MYLYSVCVGSLTKNSSISVLICRYASSATKRLGLSSFKTEQVVEAYKRLGLSPDEEIGPIEVREAFFRLAKRYHPDTGAEEASSQKFAAVKDAYQTVMDSGTVEGVGTPSLKPDINGEQMTSADEAMAEFARKFDIRHTAPQHRQYLSFDGFGRGSPMQRSRQHDKHRAESAAVKAVEYRIEKIAWKDEKHALVIDKKRTKDVKTRFGMERVVEDLIQESMQKGEFDVIKGKGKPLKPGGADNPHTDFMTAKINEILINNGYQPEWVELGKEIRKSSQEAKDRLLFARCSLGEFPFETEEDAKKWEIHVKNFDKEWKAVGKKIEKFNLVVPTLNQQIIPRSSEKEIQKILHESEPILRMTQINPINPNSGENYRDNNAYTHYGVSPIDVNRNCNPEAKSRETSTSSSSSSSTTQMDHDSPMDLFRLLLRNIFRWNRKNS